MGTNIEARLAELGITLPAPAAPAANYVPYAVAGGMIYVAGQIPVLDGELKFTGRLGDGVSIEDGYQAARLCGLNIIAQAKAALDGDLGRVKRVAKLGGFVNCTADFNDHPKVVNGASDLMVEVFGDSIGQHARFAVGAPSLPLGVTVEVDAMIEIG